MIQNYLMDDDDVTMMIKTFRSAFRHAVLWKIPYTLDLIIVGSNTPLNPDAGAIAAKASSLAPDGKLPLEFVLSRDQRQIDEIVANSKGIPLNTDDKPVLEFRVARHMITSVK